MSKVLWQPAFHEFSGQSSNTVTDLPEKYHPPRTYKFPKRKFGTTVVTERSFQSSWCDKYKWLHYDKVQDREFCYLCMKAEKEDNF